MARKKAWEDFEALLATIHKTLAPGADVVHNHHEVGRSGRRRQIDILISQSIGPYRARIAIECRDYKRPITIDKVEAFVTKLGDVGGPQGVMVSRAGFDAGAKAAAADHSVTLLTYREATDLDWQAATLPTAWVRLLNISKDVVQVSGSAGDGSTRDLAIEDVIVNHRTGVSSSVGEVAKSVVRQGVPERPGRYDVDFTLDEEVVLSVGDEFVIQKMRIVCQVSASEYPLNMSLAAGNVLTDSSSGEIKYREFFMVPWDMHQIMTSAPWREMTAEEYDAKVAERGGAVALDPTKTQRYLRMVVRPDLQR